jgi:hypothetical protein
MTKESPSSNPYHYMCHTLTIHSSHIVATTHSKEEFKEFLLL